jgi:hypothetical protein
LFSYRDDPDTFEVWLVEYQEHEHVRHVSHDC